MISYIGILTGTLKFIKISGIFSSQGCLPSLNENEVEI